jgi:hypothetical protein
MSLVHLKEYWDDKKKAGANWKYYKKRMTGQEVPENVRKLNTSRIEKASEVHAELTRERKAKIASLSNKPQDRNDSNIKMQANNQLYVEYLERVEKQLGLVKDAEQKKDTPESEIKALKLKLQDIQSRALFFANEAYLTAPAAEQVVLNQQIGLGLKIPLQQYLTSINEQAAFIGEQLHHANGNFGKALWKTAKYTDRLLLAVRNIDTETKKTVFSQNIRDRVNKLTPLVKTLIADIKKNEKLKDSERDSAAEKLARKNSSSLGSSTEKLARLILDLQVDVSLALQDYLSNNKQAQ